MRWKRGLLKLNMVLLCLAGLLFYRGEKAVPVFAEQAVSFSETGSFYETDIAVELETPAGGTIYYTLDGSVPSRDSSVYEEPIVIRAEEGQLNVQTLRAMAVSPEGEETAVFTHTYFVGETVRTYFPNLVVAVTCDPYNLYDYEYGIFVPGKLRDEYMAENPGVEMNSKYPANFNLKGREAERDAHVEILESDGTLAVSQDVGLRTHGGTTRAAEQKSMKLYARSDYGNSQLSYALFPDGKNWSTQETQTTYRTILLRNNGNDFSYGYVRDECVQRLAAEAGYLDTQESRPAAVFLNGEYYGFEWLKEVYDETYFHENYGTDPYSGSWEVLELKDRPAEPDDPDRKSSVQAAEEWNEIAALAGQDFRDDAVFQTFCEKVDLDGFLLYCAIEIYFANPDWPINNCKVYRWYSANGVYGEGATDGKWRFLLYDMDNSMGLTGDSVASDHSLAQVMNLELGTWKRYFPLFTALMDREDMRERFSSLLKELMATTFSEEHICQVLDELTALRQQELDYYMEKRDQDGIQSLEEQLEQMEESLRRIRDFAEDRPEEMLRQLEELGF